MENSTAVSQISENQKTPLWSVSNFFSWKGRVSCGRWWANTLLIIAIGCCLMYVAGTMLWAMFLDYEALARCGDSLYCIGPLTHELQSKLLVLYLPIFAVMIWIWAVNNIKRFHDLDKRGWWQLVPVYSSIALAFFSGNDAENRFGKR